jgi:plastocyanin
MRAIGKNSGMNFIKSGLRVGAALALLSACAGGSGAAWTYAPLGPTQSPAASGAASPTPGASPGVSIDVATNQDKPIAFTPNVLNAPPATVVTVNYNNNSNQPHNINFFEGADNTANSLGATEIVTGPNAPRSVTFTTPAQPGDYFFWCDVHTTAMTGTLHVAQ